MSSQIINTNVRPQDQPPLHFTTYTVSQNIPSFTEDPSIFESIPIPTKLSPFELKFQNVKSGYQKSIIFSIILTAMRIVRALDQLSLLSAFLIIFDTFQLFALKLSSKSITKSNSHAQQKILRNFKLLIFLSVFTILIQIVQELSPEGELNPNTLLSPSSLYRTTKHSNNQDKRLLASSFLDENTLDRENSQIPSFAVSSDSEIPLRTKNLLSTEDFNPNNVIEFNNAQNSTKNLQKLTKQVIWHKKTNENDSYLALETRVLSQSKSSPPPPPPDDNTDPSNQNNDENPSDQKSKNHNNHNHSSSKKTDNTDETGTNNWGEKEEEEYKNNMNKGNQKNSDKTSGGPTNTNLGHKMIDLLRIVLILWRVLCFGSGLVPWFMYWQGRLMLDMIVEKEDAEKERDGVESGYGV